MNSVSNIELLSPAGNFEKLRNVIRYGADAVYLSGKNFGLRAKSHNFDLNSIDSSIRFLHSKGKKGYVTVNIFARNTDIHALKKYLSELNDIGPDALIITDPGVLSLIKDMKIPLDVHISTQVNTTNYMAVKFWEEWGVKRVILARELSLEEIAYICKNTNLEIEIFAHGSMCISYSGRCLLSSYFTGKDANRGECTHPCRWNYSLMEESRPSQYFPVMEDASGSYILNSRDLCLIGYLRDLVNAGVTSFKIEGRMKSIMYCSVITGVYRKALDRAIGSNENYIVDKSWHELLSSVSNREYTTGFISGKFNPNSINHETSTYVRKTDFIGIVKNSSNGVVTFLCKSKVRTGDVTYILMPDLREEEFTLDCIFDENCNIVPHTKPNKIYKLKINACLPEGSIIRKYKNDSR